MPASNRRSAARLAVLVLLVLLIGGCGGEDTTSTGASQATTVAPTTTVAATTTPAPTATAQATTTRPATTRPIKLVVGKYCAAMHAAGWSFEKARAYYDDHGQPAHMDADGDGIPCETVYGEVRGSGSAPAPGKDCDPSYPDACLKVGIGDYDCAGGSGNGPNCVEGPVTVRGPDPFGLDDDGDGVGCEA
jgi:hypothetical protein